MGFLLSFFRDMGSQPIRAGLVPLVRQPSHRTYTCRVSAECVSGRGGPGRQACLGTPTHQRLDEPPPLLAHLLEVTVDVEDAVFLGQLDVGVDGKVHAGPAGAVTACNRTLAVNDGKNTVRTKISMKTF